jgi:hypothetical protein
VDEIVEESDEIGVDVLEANSIVSVAMLIFCRDYHNLYIKEIKRKHTSWTKSLPPSPARLFKAFSASSVIGMLTPELT